MKNMIKIFENDEFGKVRTVIKDGEPWLVGKDVAEILGYSNTRDALSRHVDTEDKTTVVISDSGSNYKSKTTIINESGFYSLVLSSKMPRAKEFRRWVTATILPTLREPAVTSATKKCSSKTTSRFSTSHTVTCSDFK